MSFSSEIKIEIAKVSDGARHCRLAELAAFLIFGSCRITECGDGSYQIRFQTEHLYMAEKYVLLLKQLFGLIPQIEEERQPGRNSSSYVVNIDDREGAVRILEGVKLIEADGSVARGVSLEHSVLLRQECCRRAFLRGAFLVCGSISDPNRSYHLEMVCNDSFSAAQLCALVRTMEISAKSIIRKKYHVVYIKESDEISRMLGLMGSRVGLMNFENIRILREVRGNVNRKVNCETANINKTVTAAVRQVEDIEYIRDTIGLESLSKVLDEMARVRLQYREASLTELGSLLDPPVGKSGVNHRLRKLSKIAEVLRENRRSIKNGQ
ncbi:MAG TPA: DNA-binding protein WhiA [Lachnospiraceae bacterium]|nr:DNA-binding protein WhiA [Lachnospiraceae bacterium]